MLNTVSGWKAIDALYERQMIEEEKRQAKNQPGPDNQGTLET